MIQGLTTYTVLLEKLKFSKDFVNINWSPNQIFFTEFFSERFDQFQTLENDFESTIFAIFAEVVHNFGKSDDVIIQ